MMKKTSSYLLMGALGVGFTLTAQAAVLINYDSTQDYSSANKTFARTASEVGTGEPYVYRNPYSDTANLSPNTDYSGPTFYGGYEFSSSTLAGPFNHQNIRTNVLAGQDVIYLQNRRDGGFTGSTLSLHGIYMFLQQDFNSGYQTGPLSIEGFSIETTGYITTSDPSSNFEGRLAIRIDSVYYLSDTTMNLAQQNGSLNISGPALNAVKWATYDPSSDLNFDAGAASFVDMDLTNITAVGLYFEEDGWTGTSSATVAYGLGIKKFEVSGAVIPEPSQMGALLGAVCLLSVLMARRRAKS
jgi:hypothetical protein